LILIPLAWLAIIALVVAVCRAASRADTEPVEVLDVPLRAPGLTVCKEPVASATA
jgi:hypothetical protein